MANKSLNNSLVSPKIWWMKLNFYCGCACTTARAALVRHVHTHCIKKKKVCPLTDVVFSSVSDYCTNLKAGSVCLHKCTKPFRIVFLSIKGVGEKSVQSNFTQRNVCYVTVEDIWHAVFICIYANKQFVGLSVYISHSVSKFAPAFLLLVYETPRRPKRSRISCVFHTQSASKRNLKRMSINHDTSKWLFSSNHIYIELKIAQIGIRKIHLDIKFWC